MKNKTFAIIVLGASGDLTKRKLIPALQRLFEQKEFDDTSIVVGSGRSEFTDEAFRDMFSISNEFKQILYYRKGHSGLKAFLASKGTFDRVIVFMALPPEVYAQTAKELYEEGFTDNTSVIIEKPFGYDYTSAIKLNNDLSLYYPEFQIYRNDHYLAKEAVQNIMVFRFANTLFQPMWNAQCIESIQINATETQGVLSRGPYFDKAGIIRDMVQNHIMQLLCLVTMEAPISLRSEDINAKKVDILRSMKIDKCYRYQYEGYRNEKGVQPQSSTETYAELSVSINNYRWAGMPIYIRCGKALNRTGTEISITFKPSPKVLFNENGTIPANTILFQIQPAEGIVLNMSSKEPGNEIRLSTTSMAFCYRDSFEGAIPEAYQRILQDVLHEDHTLFVTARESEFLWKITESVVDAGELVHYKKGELPPTAMGITWTDFERYSTICS